MRLGIDIRNLVEWCFTAAVRVHRAAVWLLQFLARWSGRLLGRLAWSTRLGLLCTILGGVSTWAGLYGFRAYLVWADFLPPQIEFLQASGLASSFESLSTCLLFAARLLLIGGLLTFWRHRFSYHILKVAAAGFAVVWLWALRIMYVVPSVMFLSEDKVLPKDLRNYLWVYSTWGWLPFFLLGLLLLLCLCLSEVTRFYGGRAQESLLLGDRILHNLRTQGGDPAFRTAANWATFLHLFVLFILPFLLGGGVHAETVWHSKGDGTAGGADVEGEAGQAEAEGTVRVQPEQRDQLLCAGY